MQFDTAHRPNTPRRCKCNTKIELIMYSNYVQTETQTMVQDAHESWRPTVVAFKHRQTTGAFSFSRRDRQTSSQQLATASLRVYASMCNNHNAITSLFVECVMPSPAYNGFVMHVQGSPRRTLQLSQPTALPRLVP